MNSGKRNRRTSAFTLVEMLVVMGIIAILAALLLPTLSQGQSKARRIQCVNNLKEAGVGFHSFAHDHHDKFPMQVAMADGGSLEFVQNGYLLAGEFYFSFRHFASLSNEVVTPKMLHCPADLKRPVAENFGAFSNASLSYFVGVGADMGQPGSILAGDRNITNDWGRNPSIVHAGPGNPLHWTDEMHRNRGNVLFADAHAEELNDARLAAVQSVASGDLFQPSWPPPGAPYSSSAGTAAARSTGSGPQPMAGPGMQTRVSKPPMLLTEVRPVAAEATAANPVKPAKPAAPVARPIPPVKLEAPDAAAPSLAAVMTVPSPQKSSWLIYLLLLLLLAAALVTWRWLKRRRKVPPRQKV